MAVIAIDCDGVLASFDGAFAEVVNRLKPGTLPPNWSPKQWNYGVEVGEELTDRAWRMILDTENFWLSLAPYMETMHDLAWFMHSEKNHAIYIVTSRSETKGMSAAHQTEVWLHSCGIRTFNNYLGVVVVPDSRRKKDIYRAIHADISIDDRPETVLQCESLDGHKAYLLDRSWNQEAKVQRRVKTLKEFLSGA